MLFESIIVKASIVKLPKILIFRFQNDNNKNIQKIPVQYSQIIDIRPFLDLDLRNESSKYELFALNHSSSGHYISTILLEKDNSWYEFNDEYCKKIDPYSVFTYLNSNCK